MNINNFNIEEQIDQYLNNEMTIAEKTAFEAKVNQSAELQKEVRFSDFAGEFFLIWLFPIGVWFVQPKVNKIMEE